MKKIWWFVFSAVFLFLITGGGCVWGWKTMVGAVLKGEEEQFFRGYKIANWCGGRLLPVFEKWPEILEGTYLVLLQNNMELRPSGGFMGSYARVELRGGVVKKLVVQDIYEPDGKLPGHVEPPYPVQEAFRQGWWKLRDSNWDPDFASAAATVNWFFEQGGEEEVKGVVAINLGLVERWLGALGGVELATYDEKVTEKNMYSLAQSYAELNWKPGSTQKRDFLGAVGVALVEKTKQANLRQLVKLGQLVREEVEEGQIWMWVEDGEIQAEIEKHGFAGRIKRNEDEGYVYIVEANLGANKANCCVERKITHDLEGNTQVARETIKVEWKNENEFSGGRPPVFWGGDYVNYVRVVVPAESAVEEVVVGETKLRKGGPEDFAMANSLRQEFSWDMYVVEDRGEVQMVGFWVKVPAKEKVAAVVKLTNKLFPTYIVRRQPGIEGFDYVMTRNGKIIWTGWVGKDMTVGEN